MATHPAIIVPALKGPLTIQHVPTWKPAHREIQVRVEWVPSTPLDVWQVDAGLMVQFPQTLGDTAAGTVVAVGPDVKRLQIGDQVFGMFFQNKTQKGQQVYVTAPETLFGKVPQVIPLSAAATIPTNFCTAFFALFEKLKIELPWPRPENFTPSDKDVPLLIWGAASSVGQSAVQILKHWGYTNVIATSSPKHHARIKAYGAAHVFDYRDPNIIRVFDSVASKYGSLIPISKIATQPGSAVAAVLPVVISTSAEKDGLKLSPEVSAEAPWASGVEIHPIVVYNYEENQFLRDHLQAEIMPTLLAQGAIEPNKQQIVEGETLLDRARKALDIMRSGTVSGERLVWQVWTEEEFPEFK
ncbi:alcohol dehydrogenase [Aspergillus piperis CBS 112811]|uniref:Alcohol dehydrogenase n=1 Tax=Aspergillus piperis CBS 112811 TaxID=1448313 RepID=A0A8G1VGP1_9EURO|nr:alcohol dehydrogenase [Aspergillus piperis CBS 112811]RAH52489.1 alcohol dehydrogenase [Aspergillus piperis CBS 112811]